ncbi:hypothetical protein PsYK624_172330 [Phanerochaete sordida]|uniref:Uncharacterized protein n=1 Tax=Phanerochaete sordida TaxID=48140 RepID=A0A9P3GTC2_9APHY|nr:hypothetical protein PsYK624_172330 [Phanerochaete sordida]
MARTAIESRWQRTLLDLHSLSSRGDNGVLQFRQEHTQRGDDALVCCLRRPFFQVTDIFPPGSWLPAEWKPAEFHVAGRIAPHGDVTIDTSTSSTTVSLWLEPSENPVSRIQWGRLHDAIRYVVLLPGPDIAKRVDMTTLFAEGRAEGAPRLLVSGTSSTWEAFPLHGAGQELLALREDNIHELRGMPVHAVFNIVARPSSRADIDYIICAELTYLALASV